MGFIDIWELSDKLRDNPDMLIGASRITLREPFYGTPRLADDFEASLRVTITRSGSCHRFTSGTSVSVCCSWCPLFHTNLKLLEKIHDFTERHLSQIALQYYSVEIAQSYERIFILSYEPLYRKIFKIYNKLKD